MIPDDINSRCRNTTLQAIDLELSQDFRSRPVDEASTHRLHRSLESIVGIFALSPEHMLQNIADVALTLCNADSAGVSIETRNGEGLQVFHWAAVSGEYAPFQGSMLPHSRMPCKISLDTMRSQHIRVPSEIFTELGMSAAAITDGLSIPWHLDGKRGTVWVLAHGRHVAFDVVDHQIMRSLGALAAAALTDLDPQERLRAYVKAKDQPAALNKPMHRNGSTGDSAPQHTFLFGLKTPRPKVCMLDAERLEVHGDQLILLNRTGDLVALIVLDTVADWCVMDRVI